MGDHVVLEGTTKFVPGWKHEKCVVTSMSKNRVWVEKLNKVEALVDKKGTLSIKREVAKSTCRKVMKDPEVSKAEAAFAAPVAASPEQTEAQRQQEEQSARAIFGMGAAGADGDAFK